MSEIIEFPSQFTDDELKLLLVAVRQMRRTFARARKRSGPLPSPAGAPSLEAYAALYDHLFEKLRRMAGPIPETVESALE
jgi:hypothetical protein